VTRWFFAFAAVLTIASAAPKEFWENKAPAAWTAEEKEHILGDSPWARQGVLLMSVNPGARPGPGYGNDGRPSTGVPDVRPGVPPGGMRSVPIGEKPPPVPSADRDRPLEFPVLARWESATPVRLAGGPETPEMTGQFYVIRLRGVPLMAPKAKPGEAPSNPNEAILQALKSGTWLLRKNKPPIPCAHVFTGTGEARNEVLLFFPRGADPLTVGEKEVTLDSRFLQFQLSIKFPLKDMRYKGELAL
jgi:hypothetical protein